MKKYTLLFIAFFGLLGCEKPVDIDSYYNKIQDKQTKFVLTIDNKTFYENDAVFQGHLEARNNYFVMNYFNQYGGSYILSFGGAGWYNQKQIAGRLGGTSFSNLMIGKVVDSTKNVGVGYLMSAGNIEPITISKSKLVFRVSGIVKKYPNVSESDPSFDFDGYVISKNPEFSEYSIPNQ